MGFIAKLFGGGKKPSQPKPQVTPTQQVQRNTSGVALGEAGMGATSTLSATPVTRSTFLGG